MNACIVLVSDWMHRALDFYLYSETIIARTGFLFFNFNFWTPLLNEHGYWCLPCSLDYPYCFLFPITCPGLLGFTFQLGIPTWVLFQTTCNGLLFFFFFQSQKTHIGLVLNYMHKAIKFTFNFRALRGTAIHINL